MDAVLRVECLGARKRWRMRVWPPVSFGLAVITASALAGCAQPMVQVASDDLRPLAATQLVILDVPGVLSPAERAGLQNALGAGGGAGQKMFVTPAFAFRPRSVGARTAGDTRWIARPDEPYALDDQRWEAVFSLSFESPAGARAYTMSASLDAARSARDRARRETFAELLRQVAQSRAR